MLDYFLKVMIEVIDAINNKIHKVNTISDVKVLLNNIKQTLIT